MLEDDEKTGWHLWDFVLEKHFFLNATTPDQGMLRRLS